MPDFPLSPKLINQISISTYSPEVGLFLPIAGVVGTFGVNTIWPAANLAMYLPVEIYQPATIANMSVNNGTTVAGNVDVGIYDMGGKRLVSSGTIAQAGVSAIQTFDITDTLLVPGLYYMAMASDSATATFTGWTINSAVDMRGTGICQQASAFVLPDPAVFATFAQTIIPLISMTPKTTI